MATVDEVRAFMQNCSNLGSKSEVGRGLDAARDVATHIHQAVESFDSSLWRKGLTNDHKSSIRVQLKRRLIDEVLQQGRIPVELPTIAEVEVENGWGLVHIRATVRSRAA